MLCSPVWHSKFKVKVLHMHFTAWDLLAIYGKMFEIMAKIKASYFTSTAWVLSSALITRSLPALRQKNVLIYSFCAVENCLESNSWAHPWWSRFFHDENSILCLVQPAQFSTKVSKLKALVQIDNQYWKQEIYTATIWYNVCCQTQLLKACSTCKQNEIKHCWTVQKGSPAHLFGLLGLGIPIANGYRHYLLFSPKLLRSKGSIKSLILLR